MYSSLFGHGNSIAGTTYDPGHSWPVKTRRLSHISRSAEHLSRHGRPYRLLGNDRPVSFQRLFAQLFAGVPQKHAPGPEDEGGRWIGPSLQATYGSRQASKFREGIYSRSHSPAFRLAWGPSEPAIAEKLSCRAASRRRAALC